MSEAGIATTVLRSETPPLAPAGATADTKACRSMSPSLAFTWIISGGLQCAWLTLRRVPREYARSRIADPSRIGW